MLLIEGAELCCPATGRRGPGELLVAEGRIQAIGPGLDRGLPALRRLSMEGALLCPAGVDLCADFADPGDPARETLCSGSEAAAAAGVARVLLSPDTSPPMDDPHRVAELASRAAVLPGAQGLVAASLTLGLEGRELADLGLMAEAGAVAFSDGGRPLADAELLRRALEYARPFGLPVLLRPAEPALEGRGLVHEGAVSLALGLRGIPAEAEELGVARAIALCRLSGAAIHLCPISTARSLRLLREARAEGLPITASTTALHLAWGEEAHLRRPYEPRLLLRPPLRPAADREALREAARDGTLLAAVSQHRPWGRVQMDLEFGQAPWGAAALESTLGLLLQTFGEDLQTALRLWSTGPASLLGGGAGLVVGAVADLCALEYRSPERRPRRSLAANDPVEGPLPGRVRLLVRGGRVVVGPLPPG